MKKITNIISFGEFWMNLILLKNDHNSSKWTQNRLQLKLDGRIRPNKLLYASQLINLQNDHTALAQQSFHPWFNDHNSSKITHWYLINFLKNYTSQRNEPILSAIMRKNSYTFFWCPYYNVLTKGANQYLVKSVLCTVWKKHGLNENA